MTADDTDTTEKDEKPDSGATNDNEGDYDYNQLHKLYDSLDQCKRTVEGLFEVKRARYEAASQAASRSSTPIPDPIKLKGSFGHHI
jgi:hypothetical protein